MFMIVWNATSGVVAKQTRLPPLSFSGSRPYRTRNQWMHEMNAIAAGWNSEFYAFRHGGQWHLCSAYNHVTPIRSIPDGPEAQGAAEMWVMHKERKR